MPILDPKTHKVTFSKIPIADPNAPESFGPPLHGTAVLDRVSPSAYWGDEKIWSNRSNNHNSMFDKKGRVWLATSAGLQLFGKTFSKNVSATLGLRNTAANSVLIDRKGRIWFGTGKGLYRIDEKNGTPVLTKLGKESLYMTNAIIAICVGP